MDELVWGALWIYKATADDFYLNQARITDMITNSKTGSLEQNTSAAIS